MFPFHFHLVTTAGVIVAFFYCCLKQLGGCLDAEHGTVQGQSASHSEAAPILLSKEVVFRYGATEEQPESSMCSAASAEDLYNEKICKLCYDEARSCFFIPCGYGFTCFTCARRYVSNPDFEFDKSD
jgi:hypothetical protein